MPSIERTGSPEREPSYAFGPFLFDPADQRLLMDGTPVPASPKVLETLKALIEHRGRLVDKEDLMQRVWPDAFVQEATLARHVSELRRVLGEPARGGKYVETVPTRGYRFIAPVEVIEPADYVATVVENGKAPLPSAEEQVVAPSPLQPNSSPTRSDARRLSRTWLVAALVVCVLGAIMAWRSSRSGPSPAPRVESLAVLPFETFGQSEDDRILAMGLADSLIGRLADVADVAIRPLGAVRQYANSTADPVEVGRRLRVETVLTGSIQRDGAALKVSAHLVRVNDGVIVWSGDFDDHSGTLFEVQRSMATQVAAALSPILSHETRARIARRETTNPEAGLAYIRGRYFVARRTNDGVARGVEYLEQAVRADPQFALAYAALADAYLLSSGMREREHEMVARARAAAHKALELDPLLGEAHNSLALIAMNYDWNWAAAEREYQTAIRLSPQYATAHAWYGEFLAYMGRFDEGLAAIRRARDLDPLSLIINTDTGLILYLARRYDQAIAQLQQTLELDLSYPLARYYLAYAYSAVGRHTEAIETIQFPGRDDEPVGAAVAAIVYAQADRMQEARAAVDRLTTLSTRTYVSPFFHAFAHASLGNLDEAFAAFDRMCDERGHGAIIIKVIPLSDPLRHDPRFPRLLRRLGFEP